MNVPLSLLLKRKNLSLAWCTLGYIRNRKTESRIQTTLDIKTEKPLLFSAKTENPVLKNEKSARPQRTPKPKNRSVLHKNRKTDLKNSQLRETENPNVYPV